MLTTSASLHSVRRADEHARRDAAEGLARDEHERPGDEDVLEWDERPSGDAEHAFGGDERARRRPAVRLRGAERARRSVADALPADECVYHDEEGERPGALVTLSGAGECGPRGSDPQSVEPRNEAKKRRVAVIRLWIAIGAYGSRPTRYEW
jgi:hypothetical protein